MPESIDLEEDVHCKSNVLAFPILFFLLVVTPMGYVAADDRLDYVSQRLDDAIEQEFIGAAVVGVYDSGEVHYLSKGRLSKGSEVKPNETTLFEIGSITKVFTAALTQALVDSEVLSWDSTIETALKNWRMVNNDVRDISLRELATHSSGLPRMPLNWRAIDPLDPYVGYDRQKLQAFISRFDPPQLQKVSAYSNLGFGLLGNIAANAAQQSYLDALTELVLDPLGMQNTSIGITQESRANLAQGFAQGAMIPNWNFESLEGAGALLSSAEDLVKFIRSNIEHDDSPISRSLQQLQQIQVKPNQAFGWATQQGEMDDLVFWHSGLTGGYASFIAVSPSKSKGWVVLTTSSHGGLVNEIGRSFFTPVADSKPLDLSGYVGVYRLAGNTFMTISERNNQLFGQATGQAQFPLTHVEDRKYKFDPAGIALTFQNPRRDKSNSFAMTQGTQTIKANRVEDRLGIPKRMEIEIEEEILEDYAGNFRLAPRAVLTVLHRNGQLFAMMTDQPTFPIFPMGKDKFFYKQVDAELLFQRNSEGDVTSLTLIQAGEHQLPKIKEGEALLQPLPSSQPNRPRPVERVTPPSR